MIQFDVFGGETQIKEAPKKATKKAPAKKAVPAEALEVSEKSTSSVYMTIEKNVTLKPHGIVTHTKFIRETKTQNEKSLKNIKPNDGEFNGYMSPATSRYVKRIVENWLTAIEMNSSLDSVGRDDVFVTFVTLTLPSKQIHHDNVIKNECLDPFLEWMRANETKKGWNVKAYLWRAEAQKEGNIHFHLICDRWIDHKAIRRKWNQLVERLGYISAYRKTQEYFFRKGFRVRTGQMKKDAERLMYVVQNAIKDQKIIPNTKYIDNPEVRNALNYVILDGISKKVKGLSQEAAETLAVRMQEKAYQKGVQENWSNPNSTDVHKLGNIYSISAYITKYVSKSDVKLPDLKKNQRKMGDYIYTLREGGSWDNVDDWTDETKYIVKYESRKVRGRIWGKSRSLSDGKDGRKIEAPSFTTEIKVLFREERFDKPISVIHQNELVEVYAEQVKTQIPKEEIDRMADIVQSDYCEIIPLGEYQEIVDHKTKKKKKVFRVKKQIDYLKKLSSTVLEAYEAHYRALFQNIYAEAA